jgi:hypothetical protein
MPNESEVEKFSAAVHEIGHVSMLPGDFEPHVSFLNPCDLCLGEEGKEGSLAHVGCKSDEWLGSSI